MDLADHLAAGEERRHRLEQLAPRPERARAHRGEHLVAAERVEVGPEVLDVDRHVRHGLGAVDEDERAGRVGHLDHLADRVDRAQRVRDVGERDELRAETEEDLEDVEPEQAVVGDRDELEVAVLLLDEELPRDEVRVVLHLGEHDRVAARDVLPAPRVGDEVDRLGRVAGEDHLVGVGGVDEPGDLRAGPLVLRGRLLADRVDPAVDVRVVLAVVGVERRRSRPAASGSTRPSRGRRAGGRGSPAGGSGSRRAGRADPAAGRRRAARRRSPSDRSGPSPR